MRFITSAIVALAAIAELTAAAPIASAEGEVAKRDPQRDGTLYVIKRDAEAEVAKRDPQRDGTLYVIKREAEAVAEADTEALVERDPQRDGTLYVIKRDVNSEENLESIVERDPQRDGTLYVIKRDSEELTQEDIVSLAEREPMLYEAIERMI